MLMLFFDDSEARYQHLVDTLPASIEIRWAKDPDVCLALLDSGEWFDLVSLDHDLDLLDPPNNERTGKEIATYIALHMDAGRRPMNVMIHSHNPDGAKAMAAILRDGGIVPVIKPFKVA